MLCLTHRHPKVDLERSRGHADVFMDADVTCRLSVPRNNLLRNNTEDGGRCEEAIPGCDILKLRADGMAGCMHIGCNSEGRSTAYYR